MQYFFDLTEQFIIHCEAKNLVPDTIKFYKAEAKRFSDFAGNIDLSEINQQLIERYIFHLKKNTNANDTTINTYLRGLRSILYYGMSYGAPQRFTLHLIKADKKCKPTYSESDLERLVSPDSYDNAREYRISTIEKVLLSTGIRISSLINIKTEDIDFDKKLLILRHTKNRNQTILPITDTLVDIIKEYQEIFGIHEYLFTNSKGEMIDRHTLEIQISKFNRSKGVSITSAHAFRHTFAKMAVKQGIDVFTLQKLLCHRTLSITQNYVNLYGDDLRTNWSPLDNIISRLYSNSITLGSPYSVRGKGHLLSLLGVR